jgi:hypothetical protein
MPRKKIKEKVEEKIVSSQTTVDELLSNRKDEHIIMQLDLSDNIINSITNISPNSQVKEPTPYEPIKFSKDSEEILENKINIKRSVCFWCCHELVDFCCGLPLKYTEITNHFECYGTFCSFQCASAYNFSINSKNYKVWDINTLLNMLASKYGIRENIKPAPSRYVLQMFGGNLSIEEFRMIHKEHDRSLVLNIPPMTNINPSIELLNTSYMNVYESKNKNLYKNDSH